MVSPVPGGSRQATSRRMGAASWELGAQQSPGLGERVRSPASPALRGGGCGGMQSFARVTRSLALSQGHRGPLQCSKPRSDMVRTVCPG